MAVGYNLLPLVAVIGLTLLLVATGKSIAMSEREAMYIAAFDLARARSCDDCLAFLEIAVSCVLHALTHYQLLLPVLHQGCAS